MNYWLITDTHFGHDKMYKFCDRPEDFEEKILKNIERNVHHEDILIHLGDICWGNDAEWHEKLMKHAGCKRWLVRGNHDSKSYSWYVKHGWDFVAERITFKMFGKEIAFSHMPLADDGYDLNIHGHFHNSDHRRHEPGLLAIKNEKQKLIMMEHIYAPVNLKCLVI